MYSVRIGMMIVMMFVATQAEADHALRVFAEQGRGPLLVKDLKDERFAKHFRAAPFAYQDPRGWFNLRASASGAFCEAFLDFLKTYAHGHEIYIIDLREETHGFIDGWPISWYGFRNGANKGKSIQEIEEDELFELEKLADIKWFQVYLIREKHGGEIRLANTTDVFSHQIHSEQQLVKKHGLQYFRIPVTDRHPPAAEDIDVFLSFVANLPEDAWVHFHCRGGKGRSTTFLILYDIIKNGHHIPLNEIIQRNSLIGPKDLRELPSHMSWKYLPHLERRKIIEAFYAYRNDPKGYAHASWSHWLKLNPIAS